MTYNGQWAVAYSANGSTWTDISTYVVNGTMRIGRQQLTDRYTPDTFSVELLAPLTAGPAIPPVRYYLRAQTTIGLDTVNMFLGVITDVNRDYGMPYTSATGAAPADRITITAASYGMYLAGRGFATSVAIAASTTLEAAVNAVYDDGVSTSGGPTFNGSPFSSSNVWNTAIAQNETYTGNVLDYINSVVASVVSRLADTPSLSAGPNLLDGNYVRGNQFNFSDGAAFSTQTQPYNQIEFLASDNNSYTEIRVGYNSNAATVSAVSGAQPYQTYSTVSVLEDATTAQGAADLTLGILSQSQYAPFRVSTKASLMTDPLLPLQLSSMVTGRCIGSQVQIRFRSTVYQTILEGYSITQDLDDAYYTFYFSPALGQPLILDSTTFGILNTNTLGLG